MSARAHGLLDVGQKLVLGQGFYMMNLIIFKP